MTIPVHDLSVRSPVIAASGLPAAVETFILRLPPALAAAQPDAVRVRVAVPAAILTSSEPVPVRFWLQDGTSDPLTDAMVAELSSHTEQAPSIVVVTDPLPVSWYMDSHQGERALERFVLELLLPHIRQRFGVTPGGQGCSIEGIHLSAYGALYLGLKYPHLFGRITAIQPVMMAASTEVPMERITPWVWMRRHQQQLQHSCITLVISQRNNAFNQAITACHQDLLRAQIPHHFVQFAMERPSEPAASTSHLLLDSAI
ncbi:alpha/beta hydrolase-fold protein [Pokkaliibacter sp. MBI-7]|uniref:alpha/beta hydrolase-fold protein n=1 Tax=Pokkaliibacter sp. MBI-7 TaxID=3040600 RepID=UPI00244CFBA3|nr:alpha/beta hydrolase-fold protein [Pokkaliibacter sp. MBI-7]MDH2435441.1 alpha/beta hydrolase-fold protein [Pokkaliibacter sp. MBI-7]